jgi:F0F1-type ATP synthase assembly protein I
VSQLIIYGKLFAAVTTSLLIGRFSSNAGIQFLESSLTSLVSAIIGGVISSLAFSFVVLAQIFKRANPDESDMSFRYQAVIESVFSDVRLLVWCLAGAIFIPVLRHINLPFISYPSGISGLLNREQFITSIEALLAIISISILFEVCHCMFQTFIFNSQDNDKQSS